MITVRQLSYAILCLLIGFAGCFELATAGWSGAALVSVLMGSAGPLVIITVSELDGLAPVTKLRAWAYLAMLFAVCGAGIAYAFVYKDATNVHGEGILLTEDDTLLLVKAPSTGLLRFAAVKEGDRVAPGDVIGRISQDDLEDAIHEAESALADLRVEDRGLAQLEARGRVNRGSPIAPVEQAALKPSDDFAQIADCPAAGRDGALADQRRQFASPCPGSAPA